MAACIQVNGSEPRRCSGKSKAFKNDRTNKDKGERARQPMKLRQRQLLEMITEARASNPVHPTYNKNNVGCTAKQLGDWLLRGASALQTLTESK